MRKLFILLMLFSFAVALHAQTKMIENMDTAAVNKHFTVSSEGGTAVQTDVTTDKKEGTGSLKIFAKVPSVHSWGSFVGINHSYGDIPMDWSSYDTLSFWIKVTKAPTIPAQVVMRLQLQDQPNPTDAMELYIYENATILDAVHDWTLIKIPLYDTGTPEGAKNPDDKGFVISPSSWGLPRNNSTFDINKISTFEFDVVTTATDADSLEYMLDEFQLSGSRAVPFIFFNGKVANSAMDGGFTWGQSALSLEDNAGPTGKEKTYKWILGDEWGSGWTGIGWNLTPTNMAGAFKKDSLQFQYKAEPGIGVLRVQLEGGGGKSAIKFTPVADNAWHTYKVALKDLTFHDGVPAIDSTHVTALGFMSDGNSTAALGKAVYITYIWTGNPVVDVVAPVAVTNVDVTKQTNYNTIRWTDVAAETGETYFVYASKSPITDINAKNVEVVKLNVPKGVQTADHLLFSPVTDQDQTYYYAVACQDAAGNISPLATAPASVTNKGKGVATITVGAPTNFKADGDLSEWFGYVNPFYIWPSKGAFWSPTLKANTGDNDLSVTAFLYIDNNNLYVAFDVTDDYVFPDQMPNSYENDSPDLFIGLYDSRGAKHVGNNKTGSEPDYHLRFNKAAIRSEGGGKDAATLMLPGENYSWTEKTFPGSGYIIEAKIPFSLLMTTFKDNIYVKQGMRLPIDFSINDNDDGKTRKAVMCYSKDNLDLSYAHVENWTYTFLGNIDGVITSTKEESSLPTQFLLSQNYPNPFNPTTSIKYSIPKSGLVTLKVYDILGRQVAELVNKQQEAGSYNVSFDASKLTSGVYLYKIESGSFVSTKKMMLVK